MHDLCSGARLALQSCMFTLGFLFHIQPFNTVAYAVQARYGSSSLPAAGSASQNSCVVAATESSNAAPVKTCTHQHGLWEESLLFGPQQH